MHPATTVPLAMLRTADRVSPELAGRLALPLFRQVRPTLPVRPGDRAVHEHAERGTITIRGREIVTYAWGRGAETVLVVHGWRGRASQFGPIVRELRAEGYRVVGFDAPANGDSAGRRTDIRDYLAAIEELQRRHGLFHLIVGHSFGALAALTAVREGTAAGGVVAIAGMADARFLVDSFASRVGVGAATADVLARQFARRVLPDVQEPYARFDAVADPLPAAVPLLVVHDRSDREVSASEALRLHAAHGERSRLVLTDGAGHSRVLGADATLDAVTAFATGGLPALDRAGFGAIEVPAASA
ncbi:alpha/beta hydrolase [Agromyces sp. Soil535]|uniref:alpha/beta hydrolase n=1 Tax=Agromyces sp. Soil535 TaxID=1736390 RepID=UPI000A75BA08|nr:alpha/beta hydrolase [Agromyces sp. Soil535]